MALLINVGSNFIEFHNSKKGIDLKLDLPEKIINYLEIIDQIAYEKLIDTFLFENGIKNNECILILNQEVAFDKTISIEDSKDNKITIDEFYEQIPFSENIIKKTVAEDQNLHLFAVNSQIFLFLIKLLEKYNNKIKTVVPGLIFDQVDLIENDKNKMNKYNLISENKNNKNLIINKSLYFLIFIFLLFLLVFIFKNRLNSLFKPKNDILITPTMIITPTEKPIDLKAYRVNILNGSGRTGEAAALKKKLEENGFLIDSIGTTDNDYQYTSVSGKINIPLKYFEDLKNKSNLDFDLQKIISLSGDIKEDVIIVIGIE